LARIWTAIQRLGNGIAPKPPQKAKPAATKAKAKKPAAKATLGSKTGKTGKPREGSRKAEVIGMLQRKGGATLDEIMKATAWQKHTVRGFISILSSKGGMKITSTRRDSDGACVYEA
jgi:Protein of unknown function (DUF3489)